VKALAAAVAALALSASPALGASPSLARGKVLFVAACGSCHTLAAAGTHGRKGPNLGSEDSSYREVVDRVVRGGDGMPALGKTLTRRQIADIAAFVAHATAGAAHDD